MNALVAKFIIKKYYIKIEPQILIKSFGVQILIKSFGVQIFLFLKFTLSVVSKSIKIKNVKDF